MRWCSRRCRKARPTRSRKPSPAIFPWSPSRWATCPAASRGSRAASCVPTSGLPPSPLRRPLAAWSRYCRAHVRLDETIAGFAALRAWARRQGVGIVLPQRERSCLLCDAEREQWEAAGIVVGCGPEDMLLRAFDKARTLELAVACGMRIPPTRFPRTLAEAHAAAEAIGYPCILKPRFSDFWDGGRFQADHGARYVPDPAA